MNNAAARIAEAHQAAAFSSDLDTQTGCVIVLRNGWIIRAANKLASGVSASPERLVRPEKYLWIPHAEQSAIAYAARNGHLTEGAEIYLQWLPCMACANSILLAGISKVFVDRVSHELKFTNKEKWSGDFERVETLIAEGGADLIWI